MTDEPRLFRRARSRCWYTWTLAGGVRIERSTGQRDRAAAIAVARQVERDALTPHAAAARTCTLVAALDLWLADVAALVAVGKRSAATLTFYGAHAAHFPRVLGAGFLLSSLDAAAVDRYIAARRAAPVSEHTIAKELVTLRCALKLARRLQLFAHDPAAVLPVTFSAEYTPRDRTLSRAEVAAILPLLEADHAARLAFMLATSAEWGASERAQREDVSACGAFVDVRGTKNAARERTVPIVTADQRSMLAHAQAQAHGIGGALFRVTTRQAFRRELLRACAAASIAACSANDLRRTCCTWLLAAGVPRELAQKVMGHADGRMIDRVYGRMTAPEIARLMAAHVAAMAPA